MKSDFYDVFLIKTKVVPLSFSQNVWFLNQVEKNKFWEKKNLRKKNFEKKKNYDTSRESVRQTVHEL